MLESVFGSEESARESLIYSYRHGFSAFAAKLTDSQVKKLSVHPDVIGVRPNRNLKMLTTRVFDYLGLSPSLPTGLLPDTNMGRDVIIGVIDSGIMPESESFNDEGLGPIPKHWKGQCVAGDNFDPAKHCNKKLIGARYYMDGFKEKNGAEIAFDDEYKSPRDAYGHGTACASIAAGSIVPNASYRGMARGVMRGAAPRARIASYKVCWLKGASCGLADTVKAFDDAVHDGVDVLSISLGGQSPVDSEIDGTDDIALGAFHAVTKGIPVVAAAGNAGPDAQTLANVSPWILTVAATTLDRSFSVVITLGNNLTIRGQAVYNRSAVVSEVVHIDDWNSNTSSLQGKVVLIFLKNEMDVFMGTSQAMRTRPAGVIYVKPSDSMFESFIGIPEISVNYEAGTKILRYIRSTSSPTIRISSTETPVGRPIPTRIAGFSSRGPNSLSPAILKPDIAAPGSQILVASIMSNPRFDTGISLNTGTSYSAPAVAGIVALLKSLHPDWSPAALKSAVITTAWKTDPYGQPIFSEGSSQKLADPFDYGGGLINPEKARDPGLVYDMGIEDYIHYFCARSYNDSAISKLVGKSVTCPSPRPSILDVNVPSITIPDLDEEAVTVTRTVTNVGPVDSVYRAVVEPPLGINILVKPEALAFNSDTKKQTFSMSVSTSHKTNTGFFFGSLVWTDGTRNVSVPLSVRTQLVKP
ncbi:PREDICTED: subtilisin-like protease SBT3.12 [Tarenaya hassleriana]|uniref:subtilisin-like protease SBT3.12 n=1 Tax=Tarenaya hassleriana TaxID=28532 RepID=UPI00053C9A79|nr:PREDICTED: subtilisin-like protease SBT3.12 [Tarenaya hassleriana]